MDSRVIAFDHHEEAPICTAAAEEWRRAFSEEPLVDFPFLRELVGAGAEDPFVLTASGAEAINQVFWSVYLAVARKTGQCHFVASSLEEQPTMQMLHRLEELGCYAKMVPSLDSGEIDVDKLRELIGPRTALVSVTLAHGITGVIQPVEEIAELAREKGVLLHVDATYAVGKMHFSFAELGADYVTFGGELLHAGKGSGGLFVKKEKPLVDLVVGEKRQLPSGRALHEAARQATFFLDRMSLEVARLRNLLESEVEKQIEGTTIWFSQSFRLPNVSLFSFSKIHPDALLYLLGKNKIHATLSESGISFALSRMTTEEEVRYLVEKLVGSVKFLRRLSEDL